MASGVVNSLTFTPDSDGVVIVTASYSVQKGTSGTDWGLGGGASYSQVYCKQGGVYTYGPQLGMSTTRMSQIARYTFSVTKAGGVVEVGLWGNGVSTGTGCGWYDIDVTAELIKK